MDQTSASTHDMTMPLNGTSTPNGKTETKSNEMHSNKQSVSVMFKAFYGFKPSRVDRRFTLKLSDKTYLPKISNPRSDWVITAALSSFLVFQDTGFTQVRRLATIGTGSGTDAIAAIEVFPELASVSMTDLHVDVVESARLNVLAATEKSDDEVRDIAMNLVAKNGDVLEPLKGEQPFDLIYENLPNVPLHDDITLLSGQASSTYVGPVDSASKIPTFVTEALLDLHYLCLTQTRLYNLLTRGGAVLSSMGGRVPTATMLQLADAAGFSGQIVSLTWKTQSEPESVIGGYAKEEEEKGRGPFRFFPTTVLASVFQGRTPAGAALCKGQVEAELEAYRLTAVQALEKYRQGVEIGHTVVVMASVAKGSRSVAGL